MKKPYNVSIGDKIHNFTVLSKRRNKNKELKVTCRCVCGSEKEYYYRQFVSAKRITRSCGCLRAHYYREAMNKRKQKQEAEYKKWLAKQGTPKVVETVETFNKCPKCGSVSNGMCTWCKETYEKGITFVDRLEAKTVI